MTKVNPAMARQFRASQEELIVKTPGEFFRHDVPAGRRGWRRLFDAGHTHSVTNERRLDGSTMWVEGDYMCFYDAAGRITGHFGIQRDVTDRTLAAKELEQSQAELRALAARLQAIREDERTRIAVTLHIDDFPRLPDEVASHAFRIIQEALTNATRHSKATRVDVSIRRAGAAIVLGVEDNGVGFTPQALSGVRSLGLVGMRERALACGGTLVIRGEPGRGTAIAVTIPVADS